MVLAVAGAAQVGFVFQAGPGVTMSPLNYAQTLALYSGQNVSSSYTNIMTIVILKPTTTLTLTSVAVNTTKVFQSLSYKLYFNNTSVTFNGLMNQTFTLNLNKGTYLVTGVLNLLVLTTVTTPMTATWTITIQAS